MAGFAELITTLESADFFIGVLPFVITYAIFFLTLRNSPKFGENNPQAKRMSVLVSLAIAFFVSYFMISTTAYQQFFVNYFGTLVIGLMGILGLFVAFALTGLHKTVAGKYWWGVPVVLLVAAAWTSAGGLSPFINSTGINLTQYGSALVEALDYMIDTGLIWAIGLLAVVGWTLSGDEEGGDEKSAGEKLIDFFSREADDTGIGE